jgi:hypothetical protein
MKSAVVYVVSDDYCQDAVESRDSVKRHNPDMPCILVTNAKRGIPNGYDRVIQVPPRQYDMWYLDCTIWTNLALNALYDDYDSLLILDSDTYVDAPLDDMLELSNRFDLCAVHESNRQTCDTFKPIPDSFPEINIGVILVSTNERVRILFRDWMELYLAHSDVYQNNDQGPLREALWNNKDINLYIMPEEFNARWGFGVTVVSRVRILHSRSCGSEPYTNARAAREMNSVGGRRLFRPGEMWYGGNTVKFG